MSKTRRIFIIILLVLLVDVLLLGAGTILFDPAEYYGTAGEALTYEDLFYDTSKTEDLTYWYDSFTEPGISESMIHISFSQVQSTLQKTEYRRVSKVAGRVLALFRNKWIVKGRIGFGYTTDEAKSRDALAAVSPETISCAQVLKFFNSYFLYCLPNTENSYAGFSVYKILDTVAFENNVIIDNPGKHFRPIPLNYPRYAVYLEAPQYKVLCLVLFVSEVIAVYQISKQIKKKKEKVKGQKH